MNIIKLKINSVPGYSGTMTIKTNQNGVPLEKFWRDRLKDAVIDNCVEIVKSKAKKGEGK